MAVAWVCGAVARPESGSSRRRRRLCSSASLEGSGGLHGRLGSRGETLTGESKPGKQFIY